MAQDVPHLLAEHLQEQMKHRKLFKESTYTKAVIIECVTFLRDLGVIKGHKVDKNF